MASGKSRPFGSRVSGAAYGPPPNVWWSTPPLSGPPSLGSQVAPSSSVDAARLVVPESCELNQRPDRESSQPIGSSDATDVCGKLTSVHVERAGDTLSSHETRSVCRPAWNIELPLFQLAPIDGSPESPPSPFGAGSFWNVSGSLPAGGCEGVVSGTRSAPAV